MSSNETDSTDIANALSKGRIKNPRRKSKKQSPNARSHFEGPTAVASSVQQGSRKIEGNSITPAPSHIVGIGASAGGLAALQNLFDMIPPDSGAAFVVVQHLSPNFKTLMDQLLGRHSGMTVKLADDGETIRANHVYVMRPNRNIKIIDGKLRLEPIERDTTPNLPIDRFFSSLATDVEHRAIGIVLSGTGSDGSVGIKALREVGALVLVQEPADAEFDGMPTSAIRTGYVDSVGDTKALAKLLVTYLKNPNAESRNTEFREHLASNQDTLENILKRLKLACGVDFSLYKPAMVSRRFEHRMGICQVRTLPEYAQLIDEKPDEFALLKSDLLIGVTQFFRDNDSWETLVKPMISSLINSKPEQGNIRVWMVGVSSGEEVYSLAILLTEILQARSMSKPIKIFATDANTSAIDYASAGVYPPHICRDISDERLERFFKRDEGGNYVISRALRNMVVFAAHNVLEDPPFSNMDLVVCRNMLIYLQAEAQERVLSIFNFALRNNGYLWLGSSESITNGDDSFKEINPAAKIWTKTGASKRPIPPHITLEKLRRRPTEDQRFAGSRLSQAFFDKKHIPSQAGQLSNVRYRVLEELGPTGVLLSEDLQIRQVFGDCSCYMGFYNNKQVSTHIDSLLLPALSVPVATCIARVSEENHDSFTLSRIPLHERTTISQSDAAKDEQNKQLVFVDVTVKRFRNLTEDSEAHYMLIFSSSTGNTAENKQPTTTTDSKTLEQYNSDVHTRERLRELDLQLLDSKQELRNAYAELDTTSEELQSTNEELMAANEELQSTNEELQSVNEELYSVNTEYQEKIAELMELNTDLDNLLNSTGYGIIFLDSTLAIRRYTPGISKYIHLLPGDIERPITDFKFELDYKELIDDLNAVLQTGTLIVRKISTTKSDSKLSITINPYISSDKTVNGVVMTIQEPEHVD